MRGAINIENSLDKNFSIYKNIISTKLTLPKIMVKPKVPYLQYEILEYYYLGHKGDLSKYVGYPKKSKIVEGAINSLIKKELLTNDMKLTEKGIFYVRDKVDQRYNFPDYTNILFDSEDLQTSAEVGNKNRSKPVFRWYNYVEDFPSKFIEESIKKYKISKDYYILDPFVGSGTTLIQSKMLGYKSIGMDVNPLMTFISETKTNWNIGVELKKEIKSLIGSFKKISENRKKEMFDESLLSNMPKKELNQWLSPVKQYEVSSMMYLVEKLNCEKKIKNMIRFIVSKSALNCSYVAFCPGTTFYPFRDKPNFLEEFMRLSKKIIEDLDNPLVKENAQIESRVLEHSSKDKIGFSPLKGKVDLIITSPPYPNDLEYTRQTRLELYLLGFVKNMQDVQNLKKKMVKGSTKLIFKEDVTPERISEFPSIKRITDEVAERLKDKNWGFDYPKMINQYFTDMWVALENYHEVLVKDGTCILVVGDQTSKGVVIPVAEILAEIAKKIGFRDARIELHRNRRSTAHAISIPEENLILKK